MAKYLDNNGLLYFWQQLKTKLAGKVDVETGKGLSTNDFTTALKSKLEGIEASADVNVIESITYNGTAVPITSKTAAVTGPTKTSDLTNDSGFITSADVPEGAAASTTTPKKDGTAAVGTETAFARGDHVHPTDDSRQAKITASGLLKGNGSGTVTAAVAGTDYAAASHGTHVTYSTTAPKMDGTAAVGTASNVSRGDHVHPTDTSRQAKITASGILKGDGSGGVTAAVAGTDYLTTHQDISGKLDKSGGTMTGALTLSGAPTANLHAVTKKYVDDAIATSESGAAKFQGDLNAQSTLTNANYKTSWYWVVGTAGTYAGQVCEVGDMVYAVADKGSAYDAADFTVIQTNLDIASITNAEIDTILAS